MDISQSNWTENDNNNSTAAPDGAPEGMAPAGINDVLRAHQGAVKRFWNKINAVKTTAGSASAFTLAYDVAPAAYVDGEILSFVVNATNAAAATLNVNALGAIPLRLFAGNLLPGALLANQIVQARYSSSAGAFDIIPQNGWVRLGEVDASAAATVDFTSIPAGVNNLMLVAEGTVSAACAINLRTYGADGVLDTGASDYVQNLIVGRGGAVTSGTFIGASFNLVSDVDVGTTGFSTNVVAANIQAATKTKFNIQSHAQGAIAYAATVGNGMRDEAARVTGIRIFPSSGTVTGKCTLLASA